VKVHLISYTKNKEILNAMLAQVLLSTKGRQSPTMKKLIGDHGKAAEFSNCL